MTSLSILQFLDVLFKKIGNYTSQHILHASRDPGRQLVARKEEGDRAAT